MGASYEDKDVGVAKTRSILIPSEHSTNNELWFGMLYGIQLGLIVLYRKLAIPSYAVTKQHTLGEH